MRSTQPGLVRRRDLYPMRRGFLYLVAIMDWFSRKVLAWRLSNTMNADFCVAALEEVIARHGRPDIFNTDQGSQFTSFAFTTTLKDPGIRISMDGAAAGWTTSSSSGYGAASNTNASSSTPSRPGARRVAYRFLDRLVQPAMPALDLRRQDTRRGPCYGTNDGAIGGVETNPIHFSQAAKLSHRRDHLTTPGLSKSD
jgi:hypothetical protein